MKTIKLYLAAVLIAGLSFTSCSDDDDNGPSTGGEIVGKWTPTKTVTSVNNADVESDYTGNEPGCPKDFSEFVTGGVLRDVIYFKNTAEVCTEDADNTSAWTKTGTTLTIDGTTYEITRLTGSELRYKSTVSTGGATLTVTEYFSKVN